MILDSQYVCGNSLGSLPKDLKGFSQLEKILLEYNKIDNYGSLNDKI